MGRKMRDLEVIKSIVTDTLMQDFGGLRILDVRIELDEAFDTEEILRIDVILKDDPEKLDAKKLSKVLRHLGPKLSEIEEFAIPLLSFISQSDMRKKRAAA